MLEEAICSVQGVVERDPDHPNISEDRFERFDWVDFYKDAKEDLPLDAPSREGGKSVSIASSMRVMRPIK